MDKACGCSSKKEPNNVCWASSKRIEQLIVDPLVLWGQIEPSMRRVPNNNILTTVQKLKFYNEATIRKILSSRVADAWRHIMANGLHLNIVTICCVSFKISQFSGSSKLNFELQTTIITLKFFKHWIVKRCFHSLNILLLGSVKTVEASGAELILLIFCKIPLFALKNSCVNQFWAKTSVKVFIQQLEDGRRKQDKNQSTEFFRKGWRGFARRKNKSFGVVLFFFLLWLSVVYHDGERKRWENEWYCKRYKSCREMCKVCLIPFSENICK